MSIPSYRRIDHIGIVVPDLEQAITFFATTLQAQLLGRGSRAQDPEYMVHTFGAPEDAAYQMAMVRVPPDLKIELFQWTSAHRRTEMPCIADIDAHHIGIQVSDIESAVAHLEKAPGVTLIGGINEVPAGRPGAGIRFVYFRAPWGLNLELLDYSRAATHSN